MLPAKLPRDVQFSIRRILRLDEQGRDSLDTLSEFSPGGILNTLFPDEESLMLLGSVQDELLTQYNDLQEEIQTLRGELIRDQDPGRMQLIQELISELLTQMNRIREKATESEAIVQAITQEIQVLDLAKRNLTISMTTIKRLQMLGKRFSAVSQLEASCDEGDYIEITKTLAATKEIFVFFKDYISVPQVAIASKRFLEVQGRIRSRLDRDFDLFFLQDSSKPIETSTVSSACLVADVLGEDVRNHYIERYCSIELKEYRRIFKPSDEAGQLDNITRRFSWFKRQLISYEEQDARVFKASWKVGQHLVARFSEITRDDLSAILAKAGQNLTVAVLLEALQLTLDFEAAMQVKYRQPFEELVKVSRVGSKGIKMSVAFEPYMGVFVNAQDKGLADLLAASRGAKSRPSLEGTSRDAENPANILPSSTELFYFYSQNLEQCAKLSPGKPLWDLSNIHKKWLKVYAEDVLLASMKSTPKTERERRSIEGRYSEIRTACIVINTADYCHTTSSELEEKLEEKISEEFRPQVTLQIERDLFTNVISAAIAILLRELESACEPSLAMMTKMQWSAAETVSGESGYVGDFVKAVDSVLEVVRQGIEQKKYLRNFYDKAATLLITRFTNALVRSRPLKEGGAPQVMIDLQSVKACLLRFPQGMESSALSASYSKAVSKGTSRLETLLKVVNSPTDPPGGFVSNYTLLVGDSSFANFQKVLDLKGIPKTEQNTLLDTFLTMTSTMGELEAASFLSSLDMDPAPGPLMATATMTPNTSALSLPALLATTTAAVSNVGFMTPPIGSGPETPKLISPQNEGKREVFSDLRRLVTFAVRRDRESSSSGNVP